MHLTQTKTKKILHLKKNLRFVMQNGFKPQKFS